MRKVESINSRKLFGQLYPRAQAKAVPEGAGFFCGAALTLWAPTLLYCYVIGQAAPFYLIASSQVLGALVGLLKFKRSSGGLTRCVPVNRVPDIPATARRAKVKDAA